MKPSNDDEYEVIKKLVMYWMKGGGITLTMSCFKDMVSGVVSSLSGEWKRTSSTEDLGPMSPVFPGVNALMELLQIQCDVLQI